MQADGINAVRVPLNEACWNGDSYVKLAYAGPVPGCDQGLRAAFNADGMAVILNLHWTNGACTGWRLLARLPRRRARSRCQTRPGPSPSGPRWRARSRAMTASFSTCSTSRTRAGRPPQHDRGMAVLAARRPLRRYPLPGRRYAEHGERGAVHGREQRPHAGRPGVVQRSESVGGHKPADPDHNLVASWHSYNFNACSTKSCWNSQIAPVIAKVPLIAGEIGETTAPITT